MKHSRKEMMNKIISLIGMEHPWTVQFCKFCEEWEENEHNNIILSTLFETAINYKGDWNEIGGGIK